MKIGKIFLSWCSIPVQIYSPFYLAEKNKNEYWHRKHYLIFLLLFQEIESPSKNKAKYKKDKFLFLFFSCGLSTENAISPKALYLSGEEFREFT